MTLRGLVALALFWTAALLTPRARGEPSPDAAFLLEEHLTKAYRETLACLSRAKADKTAGDKCAGRDELDEILRRVAGPRNWESAMVAEILDPAQVAPSGRRTKVRQALRAAVAKIKDKSGCKSLAAAAAKAVEKIALGQPESPPSIQELFAQKDCEVGGDLAGYSLITVIGPPGEAVRVLVGGQAPELFAVDEADGYPASRATDVYFTAVPVNAPWTVSALGPGSAVRRAWFMSSPADRVIHTAPVTSTCLQVDVQVDPTQSPITIVNGAAVRAGSAPTAGPSPTTGPAPTFVYAPAQDYHIGVLSDASTREVLASEDVAAKDLDETICYRIKLDLRKHDGEVSIIGADASDRCLALGHTAQEMQERTERLLKTYSLKVRTFDDWTKLAKGMKEITGALTAAPGKTVGASRGRVGGFDQIGTAGRELIRQTSGKMMDVSLECTPRAGGTTEYVVHVAVINLAGLQRSAIGGLDLTHAQRKGSASALREEEIDAAVGDALAQVFDLPSSVRFVDAADPQRLNARIAYDVNVRLPPSAPSDATVVLSGGPLPDDDDERDGICRRPTSYKGPLHQYAVRALQRTEGASTSSLSFDPPTPGAYFLEARSGAATAYRCVNVTEPVWRFAAEVGLLFTVAPPQPNARVESNTPYFEVLAKAERRIFRAGSLDAWLGGALGYGEAHHALQAPPSWQDLWTTTGSPTTAGLAFDPSGRVDVSWARHSFLIGPSIGLEGSFCSFSGRDCSYLRRSSGWFLRSKLLLDVGVVDTGGVPSALAAFGGSGKTVGVGANLLYAAGAWIDSNAFAGSLGVEAGYIGLGQFSNYTQSQTLLQLRGTDNELRPVVGLYFAASYGL